MNVEIPKIPTESKIPVKRPLPSYWSGWVYIIAGVVVEVIGRLITGAMVNSTRANTTGGLSGMRNNLYALNQITKVQGFVDVIMVLLVIIGIIVLVRTFILRSKTKKRNST
jgi:hypothetical protein